MDVNAAHFEGKGHQAHQEHIGKQRWTWKSAGACGGLAFGILSPLLGSLFTVIAWFTDPRRYGVILRREGTVLLGLTIPFLLIGAHCLDLMDHES